ncbi:flagellar basal body P-ring protein FlgI [Consotaella salsifontis]|uniref:Flagellar P-ring protein n=1 Tax=Consotaella salsifontis TaxID=1365950 RepID=A0A1T4NRA9_9HYPH|nr:flagellar basal body P-ring protein FlgI [Consotaella salsifontis]SJZ81744.1 flagellar P-ring protein precursor FlgI [Consotaella salsifontis]
MRTAILGLPLALLALFSQPALSADLAPGSYPAAGFSSGRSCGIAPESVSTGGTRIKDISFIKGVRENQLVGYGLVIGLQGTGDSLRNSPFTEQSIQSMLDRMGVNVRSNSPRSRNVAAVIVTAELPPFAGAGSRIDITVSSMGDAASLMGGTLVMTPLYGADGEIYAVGQGPLAVTGFTSQGESEKLTQGVPTVGRISNGALVEREVPGSFENSSLTMELRNPDFSTTIRMVDVINAYATQCYGQAVAKEEDLRTIRLNRPGRISATRFIAEIGQLMVTPDQTAKVVIDERTGTVVIGKDVQILPVGVTQGNLTVRVSELPSVSQPAPFSNGQTTVTSETIIDAKESGGNFAVVQGSNLDSVVRGLNRIGLKPIGIIAILQAIKTAGALQAEIVVQ